MSQLITGKKTNRLLICSYIFGLLIIFVLVLISGFGLYHHSSIADGNATISEWKKSEWISGKNFPLATNALIAAEDPVFISSPRLDCGLMGFLKARGEHNEFLCSPVIVHAARLVVFEKYIRTLARVFYELSVQGEISRRPDEAIDIIMNKTYLGSDQDGKPIHGFAQAAVFYFGQPLNTLSVSKVALLAGMARAPGMYSPKINPQKAKDRRDSVIDRMAKSSFISESEATAAKNELL